MNWNRNNEEDEEVNDDFGSPKYCKNCGHEIIQGTICQDCEERTYDNKETEWDFCNH